MDEVVRRISGSNPEYEVEISRSPEGWFRYQLFKWWKPDPDQADVIEPGWSLGRLSGIFESVDQAEADARATVPLDRADA